MRKKKVANRELTIDDGKRFLITTKFNGTGISDTIVPQKKDQHGSKGKHCVQLVGIMKIAMVSLVAEK